MLGAKIYTRVGNEEKAQYLMDNFNLSRNRIFHSRDVSFLEDLMRETQGKGVDLVLNSLRRAAARKLAVRCRIRQDD